MASNLAKRFRVKRKSAAQKADEAMARITQAGMQNQSRIAQQQQSASYITVSSQSPSLGMTLVSAEPLRQYYAASACTVWSPEVELPDYGVVEADSVTTLPPLAEQIEVLTGLVYDLLARIEELESRE